MRKCSYRERFVHREAFTHRRLYTQRLSCKEAFTKKKYTDALHYTKILLHSAAFTHRRLYTQTLEHRRFHRHRNFYTEKPLHRTAFTQRISSPPQKLANRYLSLFFFPVSCRFPSSQCMLMDDTGISTISTYLCLSFGFIVSIL